MMAGMDFKAAELVVSELVARARSLAETEKPGSLQVERSVLHIIDERPTGIREHTKTLLVIACYSAHIEKICTFNQTWARGRRFKVAGFVFQLFDATRAQHNQLLDMTQAQAVWVLMGEELPELPEPVYEGRDPFEGLVDNRDAPRYGRKAGVRKPKWSQ